MNEIKQLFMIWLLLNSLFLLVDGFMFSIPFMAACIGFTLGAICIMLRMKKNSY